MSTCLWFDSQAEQAAKFYTSIFPNSEMGRIAYYTNEGKEFHGKEAGSVMTVEFSLSGAKFVGLNGGPIFKFNESISQVISCDTQKEIDYYWDKLSEGGDPQAQQCGWLKDKFGVSWQVTPTIMAELAASKDTAVVTRVMKAMFPMKKFNLAEIEKAAKGN